MSEFKERLKDVLEQMSELLTEAVESVEEPTQGDVGVPEVAQSMRRLSDSIHMRMTTLPADTKYLRMSRLNAILLAQVVSRWSEELDRVCDEYRGLAKTLACVCEKLEEGSKEFETERDKVLGLIEEMVPELDIKSELTEAERV